MKKIMFTVYDVKAQTYFNPFSMKTNGEAIRSFSTQCKNPESMFYQFPEDYSLLAIGEFDDETSELLPYDNKTILANATEFKERKES